MVRRMGRILSELTCASCGDSLSTKQQLFDTAWLGVFWCGSADCAFEILDSNCTEFDPYDYCNRYEVDQGGIVCRED